MPTTTNSTVRGEATWSWWTHCLDSGKCVSCVCVCTRSRERMNQTTRWHSTRRYKLGWLAGLVAHAAAEENVPNRSRKETRRKREQTRRRINRFQSSRLLTPPPPSSLSLSAVFQQVPLEEASCCSFCLYISVMFSAAPDSPTIPASLAIHRPCKHPTSQHSRERVEDGDGGVFSQDYKK